MDFPPSLPPPIPASKPARSSAWIWFAAGGAGLVVVIVALAAMGYFFMQATQRRVRATEAQAELEKVASKERANLRQTIENGNGAESIERVRSQLEKSAQKAGAGPDAPTYRSLSAALQKLGGRTHEYETAAQAFKEAELFQFKLASRKDIETKRKIVRDFLAANERLTDMIVHLDDTLRAELDANHVPEPVKSATVKGFSSTRRKTYDIQLHIRDTDARFGATALEALDLLDKNWGAWERDDSSGQLRFKNEALIAPFNALVHKVQDISAEQTKAQEELLAHSKEETNAAPPPAAGS